VRGKNFSFCHVHCLQFAMSHKQFYKSNTVQLKLPCHVLHFLANQTHYLCHNVNFVGIHDISRRIKDEQIYNEWHFHGLYTFIPKIVAGKNYRSHFNLHQDISDCFVWAGNMMDPNQLNQATSRIS
jgi:hypothetical protein